MKYIIILAIIHLIYQITQTLENELFLFKNQYIYYYYILIVYLNLMLLVLYYLMVYMLYQVN